MRSSGADVALNQAPILLHCLGRLINGMPAVLDGVTDSGTIRLSGLTIMPPILNQGMVWEMVTTDQRDVVLLRCRGVVPGGGRYLEGVPEEASIRFAQSGGAPGTRWRLASVGPDQFYVECLATSTGSRFLIGDPDGYVGLASRVDATVDGYGTKWHFQGAPPP
jgi:hypothetical protein